MAEGNNTFEGLAVPLFGESEIQQQTSTTDILTLTGASGMAADFLVCQDSSGNEIMALRQDGFLDLNATTTVSAMGVDMRMAASSTTGVNVAINGRLTMTGTGDSAQSYALWGYLDLTSWSIGGGRAAPLNLTIAGGSSSTTSSLGFICFNGTQIQCLFNLPGNDLTNGCVVANAATQSTHGIRISIGDSPGANFYYIMVTSCTD